MTREPRNSIRSGPALALLLLLGLIVAYPLSTGPASLYFRLSGETDATSRVFTKFYAPLQVLPDPAQRLLHDWRMLWYELPPNPR